MHEHAKWTAAPHATQTHLLLPHHKQEGTHKEVTLYIHTVDQRPKLKADVIKYVQDENE